LKLPQKESPIEYCNARRNAGFLYLGQKVVVNLKNG
jgi:hypothetical protein